MIRLPGKVVSALEILRSYADAYAKAGYVAGLISQRCQSEPKALEDPAMLALLRGQLEDLGRHCDDLPLTKRHIQRIQTALAHLDKIQDRPTTMASRLVELVSRLEDELEARLFFQLPSEKRVYFDEPVKGWEMILERFIEALTDVAEMRKCFALSRYPACVFHSMQVVEHGLIHLGKWLRVKDHKPGWNATTRELKRIVSIGHEKRTEWEREHFQFIEQMDAVAHALMTAWRHKIDHASGRLILLPGETNPDTAEDIMSATRAFMRRLAEELPEL